MDPKNIVIALPLDEQLLTPLHEWGTDFNWSQIDEVHFIHVVKKTITPLEFGIVEAPDEHTFQEMTPVLEKYLKEEAQKILPADFKGKIFYHISKNLNPDEETVNWLKKLKADLVVVSKGERHGLDKLFHSSFTEQMIKSAPCDVFVVRPHDLNA